MKSKSRKPTNVKQFRTIYPQQKKRELWVMLVLRKRKSKKQKASKCKTTYDNISTTEGKRDMSDVSTKKTEEKKQKANKCETI